MKVTLFSRKRGSAWSVERVFADVASNLPDDILPAFFWNRFASKGFFRRLSDTLRVARHQGDVNHVTGDVHYLTFALRKDSTVLTILDCVFMQRPAGIRRYLLWFLWLWLPVRRSTLITTISEATRKELLGWVRCDPAKVRVIHCAVSDSFRPAVGRFNAERPRILHVGTTPNKNLERHLDALRGIRCEFVLIGVPSEHQRELLEGSGLDWVVLSGLSEAQLVEQYQACDMLLFASTYEGFGLPIVEAQAVGRPVVTSDLSSMPEVAGDGACLVDPFDVRSIRAGVLRVIGDQEYRLGLVERGFANVKRFGAEEIGRRYADVYREVAGGARRRR